MNTTLSFWTASLLLLAVAIAMGFAGWRHIRYGRVEEHRRRMRAAMWLVVAFLVAYLAKVAFLGRENLALWDSRSLWILRLHETVISVMLLAGGVARWLGQKAADRDCLGSPANRWHRWFGRLALVAGLCGLVTAALVLAGMYARTR
ncbi:MAG: DUF420 domain-containing protein [Thermoanaerobaculia bacterium]